MRTVEEGGRGGDGVRTLSLFSSFYFLYGSWESFRTHSAASVAVPVDVVVAVSCWVARFLCDECVFGCWRRSSPSDFDDVSSVLTMNPTGTKRPRSTLNRQRNRQTKTEQTKNLNYSCLVERGARLKYNDLFDRGGPCRSCSQVQ